MAKKIKTAAVAGPLTHSWELWAALTANGLDTVYYDNEFLNGSTSFDGLGQHLGLGLTKANIAAELKKNNVSTEKFIDAFFKTLQPYAQMMNDLCVFFAGYEVNSSNERLQIVFDFKKQQLSFDAEVFRSTLVAFRKIKRKLTFYHLEDFWGLSRLFSGQSDRKKILTTPAAQAWREAYEKGRYAPPDLPDFNTGIPQLNIRLNRVLALWKSYIEFCRTISSDVNTVKDFVRKDVWSSGDVAKETQVLPANDLKAGWSYQSLIAEMDNWGVNMLSHMYSAVEDLLATTIPSQDTVDELIASIDAFFEDVPQSETEVEETIKELTDLLNLPVWKKRHELFSTWILSVLDDTFSDYERELHHHQGVLLLRFTGTLLLTINTAAGPLQLWAENRTPAGVVLTGHGRKKGIQPDYTIYQTAAGDPNNCIACVEVKQYRKASTANFKNAINDYAHGLLNAEVFLVNYGPVPATLALDFPARSGYFGGIKPGSTDLTDFKKKLLAKMPAPRLLSSQEKMQLQLEKTDIDHLFVDVSGSMDRTYRRKYLQVLLANLLRDKNIGKLSALDADCMHTWQSPDSAAISDLLESHFYSGADFDPAKLKDSGHSLVVTDPSHVQAVCHSGYCPIVIVVDTEDAELYVYDEDSASFICQASEPVLSIFNDGWSHAGFAGLLRPE